MSDGLRVVSWNVRALQADPLAAARVIRHLRPDLLCLQEVPQWLTPRWRLGSLARATNLLVAAGGRDAAGNGLLVSLRTRLDDVDAFRLPHLGSDRQKRGAVVARAGLFGRPQVLLAAVHLSLQQPERLRHVTILKQRLTAGSRATGSRIVVAGDLNELPGGPAWRAWEPLCRDARVTSGRAAGPDGAGAGEPPATFPSKDPRRRIDAVLVSDGVRVLEYGDGGLRAAGLARDVAASTDHWPVLAVLAAAEGAA